MKLLDHPELGKLLLRIAVGFILFLHGLGKVEHGIGGTVELIAAHGWPGWLAYGAYVGELIAPLLMMVGKFTRPAALLVAFNMLMTIVIAHPDIALKRNDFGGWMIELNAVLLLGALAVALLGPGGWSISRGEGKWD